jgi:transposase-like protein
VELPTWKEFSEEDPLHERAVEQMLVGVSTRGYARSLEPLDEDHESVGVSRSSVSRRFVARTKEQVTAFLSRPLGELDLPVIMLDGVCLAEHVLIVALGIDTEGRKHVLGLVEGSTESEGVGRSLLRNLIDRGLKVERARLFVIDGGKGVRKAIRSVFGSWALVQRCQIHKLGQRARSPARGEEELDARSDPSGLGCGDVRQGAQEAEGSRLAAR